MTSRASFCLADLFSESEIKQIEHIWTKPGPSLHSSLLANIVTPEKIEQLKAQGWEVDRDYLAYAIEYMLMQRGIRK